MATDDVARLDDIEHETTEALDLATSSCEITAPDHASVASFARYVAGFWLVRTALGLTDSALCLLQILAQTLGTPLLEPLNLLRRVVRSILDEPVESIAILDEQVESIAILDEQVESIAILDEPVESLAVLDEQVESIAILDEQVESIAVMNEPVKSLTVMDKHADGPIASNHSPNEDTNNSVHAMDDNEDTKNPLVTDEPILKTEIRESVESTITTASKQNMSIEGTEFKDDNKRNSSQREAGVDENGPKTTEDEGVKDFVEASTNHKNIVEFEEELLRKSFVQAVKDVEPFKLKTYEKRMADIVEVESTNIFNNFEECDIEAIDIMDDFKTEDNTSDEISYGKGLSLYEPSTQSSLSQDQYYPLLLEQTSLSPPVPTPTSTRRYPGFRHLFVFEPYQTRYYGCLGPVEDLLDDLILGAVQLSSSGATSTRDEPADYPLPDDSFGSSFENEF